MGLEAFKRGLETIKNDKKAQDKTKANLEKSNDKERLEVFDDFFSKPADNKKLK